MSRLAQQPARARQAVGRYLPEASSEESRFARGMAAYRACEDHGCRDRAAGEPECRDSCARAQAVLRRGS